ncbi:Vinorine synthase [Melia azedarach]|uniref:Vinorine synthase n=1 Tax=Melia azedarach TaxID=155640 RepID=A0ACC1XR32_MELAZ|nr:Vinorine synthase [Melia azedarach]
MEIQILSKKFIKPSVLTPIHLRNLKLSFLDQLPPSMYIPFILYYPEATGQISNSLQKSLSEILTLFYPLAGRILDKENLSVNCNDEGVEFIEAEVDGQLSQILNGEYEAELLNKFLPGYTESASSPLLGIQINMFKWGGVAIGICMSHRAADGFGFWTFINAWAKSSCYGAVNGVSSPSFDLGIVFPARDLSKIEVPIPCPMKTGLKIVTRRFVFDAEAITKLKAEVTAGSTSDCRPKRQVTRVEVVTALIWKAHITALRAKHGHLRDCLLLLPVNLRGNTVPNVSETCFGNIFRFTTARFIADENKMKLHDFVDLIRDAYRKPAARTDQEFGDDAFLSTVINPYKEYCEELNKEEADVGIYSSCCGFPICVDFGWGKPAWVSGIQMPFETVMLLDNEEGNGIEAWVNLDEKLVSHFLPYPYLSKL